MAQKAATTEWKDVDNGWSDVSSNAGWEDVEAGKPPKLTPEQIQRNRAALTAQATSGTPYRPEGYETKDFMGAPGRFVSSLASALNPMQLWEPFEQAGEETGRGMVRGATEIARGHPISGAVTLATNNPAGNFVKQVGKTALSIPGALYEQSKQAGHEIGSEDFASGLGTAAAAIYGGKKMGEAGTDLYKAARSGYKSLRPTPSPVQLHENLTNLAALSKTAAPDIQAVHPLLQEWFDSVGINPDDIATINKAKNTDIVGDVQRGLTKDKWDALTKKTGSDAPLVVQAAKGAVDNAHRPFKAAMEEYGDLPTGKHQAYGDLPTTDIQTQILGELDRLKNETIDDGLKTAYTKLADKVKREGGTARGLMGIKEWANKEGNSLFNLSPGGQINATARPIQAYMDVGNMIRERLYPQLKTASGGALDLSQAGAIESQAIAFRDGVWKNWNDVATQHAQEIAARTGRFSKPESPSTLMRVVTNPSTLIKAGVNLVTGRPAVHPAMAGGVLGTTLPLEQFNTVFKRGMGSMEGYAAPAPAPVGPGYHPEPAPNTIGQAPFQNPAPAMTELIPHDPNLPLLEPPPGVSSSIGQDVFGVQQRANQAARTAPPETLTGQQIELQPTVMTPSRTPVLSEQGLERTRGTTSAAEDYAVKLKQQANARQMTQGMQPPPGQLSMETATPPDLFGLPTPTGQAATVLPAGTKLVAVTSGPNGVSYHYQLANGTRFISPVELQVGPAITPPPTR